MAIDFDKIRESLQRDMDKAKARIRRLNEHDPTNPFDCTLKAIADKYQAGKPGYGWDGALAVLAGMTSRDRYKAKAAERLLRLRQHRRIDQEEGRPVSKLCAELLPKIQSCRKAAMGAGLPEVVLIG